MISKIKDTLNQIFAIVEKNIKLSLRVKTSFILRFLSPILAIIMPLIIMGQLFTFRNDFGPWNETNFAIFQLVMYQLHVMFGVMYAFSGNLRTEKYWYTLQALIIAPFKRINLLIGAFISHFIISLPGFMTFFIFCYIFYPISIITIITEFFIFFLFALVFGGIGLVIGIGAVSKENLVPFLNIGIAIIFMFSCISLPFEFFPPHIQNVINLNPLYYVINLARLIWFENNVIYSLTAHFFEFGILLLAAIISPVIGIKIFNYIFDKYGIVGY